MPRRLPPILRPFFWDYSFARLSWSADRELVTRRVLEHGSWEAVRWLRRKLGDEELRDWLVRRHGASLTPKQLRFWELILDIPRRQVDSWLADPRRQVWDRRCDA